ncbi:MAG: phosphoglycerate dehydrogenase [Planctomycetota bacterium]
MQPLPFPREALKIVLLEGISDNAVQRLRAAGYTDIEAHAGALSRARLLEVTADAHMLGIRSRTQVDAEVLGHAPRLMAVGCFCIGTNQVDLGAAQGRGVPVFNAPYSNTRSVAELVLAEVILLLRRVPEKNMGCHRGAWSKSAAGSHEARGKTLGIVGYGHIGTQLGVLAETLGMRVLFYDIESKLQLGNARVCATLDELLESADVVSLHVPETALTAGMIGARELALMKPGGLLINASRGTVVDVPALAEALRAGHLAGAAVDVFPSEPETNGERFESPLIGLDNVLLTPHIGGSTLEAQDSIGVEVAEKLIRYSDNGSTLSAVNFPEVALPPHPASARLLHVHENRPGVLSQLNDCIAASDANIDAQYLQTLGRVGYVVVDFQAGRSETEALRAAAAAVPGTLRVRLLR